MMDSLYLVYECWIKDGDFLVNELYDYTRRIITDMGDRNDTFPQTSNRKDLYN